MHIDLVGHVVLITGAGRGIGRALARTFHEEGCHVLALDADPDLLEGLADDGIGAMHLTCDVTDTHQTDAAVSAAVERFGRIDVLINNAGINAEGPTESFDMATWDRMFTVNTRGPVVMSQAVIPVMRAQGRGRIINAASFAAIIPSVGAAAYGASKAAVVQLSRVLASELGPDGITVNAYAPGMIPTEMNTFSILDDKAASTKLDQLSVRRWGEPEDVAHLCVFLAGDQASYITGALIDVSGGKFATQDPGASWRAPGRASRAHPPRD